MRTQIIRVNDSRRLRNWHLSRPRRQKQRGREWRTCLYRYPCNYGFIENDASPRATYFAFCGEVLFSHACAERESRWRWQEPQRNDDDFNVSWLLLTFRNYRSIDQLKYLMTLIARGENLIETHNCFMMWRIFYVIQKQQLKKNR